MWNVYGADQEVEKQKEWCLDKTEGVFFGEMKNEKIACDIIGKVNEYSALQNDELFKKAEEGNLNAMAELADLCTCKEVPAVVPIFWRNAIIKEYTSILIALAQETSNDVKFFFHHELKETCLNANQPNYSKALNKLILSKELAEIELKMQLRKARRENLDKYIQEFCS